MTSSFHPLSARKQNDSWHFAVAAFAVILVSAAIAALAPIAFSIVTVFLFAAPHNWIELRYCLSRLPSRFGPLVSFFATSFGGLAFLYVYYVVLICGARLGFIGPEVGLPMVSAWNLLLVGWCVALCCIRFKNTATTVKAVCLGALACAFGLAAPRWFALALVYLHPLVAMAILDRELRRTKPGWLKPYHCCVAFVPVALVALAVQLGGAAPLVVDCRLDDQITRHAGANILPTVSSHLLVAVHTFLEMLHYGVWCLAIPIATNAVKNWKPDRFAATRERKPLKLMAAVVMGISSLAVLAFWAAFSSDYSATRDFYFTAALIHVLAEVPLLIWLYEARSPRSTSVASGSGTAGGAGGGCAPQINVLQANQAHRLNDVSPIALEANA